MNTIITSKDEILKTGRKLIQQKGWSAVNIRSVASACGVSVGSIYNYFDSKKASLIGEIVESVWHEVSIVRKRLYFRMCCPVLSGCISEWNMAAGSILVFLHCMHWDFCRKRNLTDASDEAGMAAHYR